MIYLANICNLVKQLESFFISFCFVANIWYQHSMLFNDAKTMNDHIFIREFIFFSFLKFDANFYKNYYLRYQSDNSFSLWNFKYYC
ncbi:TMEM175 family protein [Pediococcus pentosaceus]